MPEPNHHRDRPLQRLAEAMVSPNSYGSVLILILLTYVLSVSMTQTWGGSLVLLVQIGTVWLALHVSSARRGVRAFATALLAIAGLVAAANLVWGAGDLSTPAVFLTSAVLYLIAPLSILRAIVLQREVDREIVLGAIDAYLLIGMFFAFVYQALGAIGCGHPAFVARARRSSPSLLAAFVPLLDRGMLDLLRRHGVHLPSFPREAVTSSNSGIELTCACRRPGRQVRPRRFPPPRPLAIALVARR